MKAQKDYSIDLLTLATTLFATLLSDQAFPNFAAKILFVILVILALFLYLKGRERGSRPMRGAAYGLAACLLICLVACSSPPGFPSYLWSLGKPSDPAEETGVPSSEDTYRASQEDLNQALGGLRTQVVDVSDKLDGLADTLDAGPTLPEADERDEVQSLLNLLASKQEVIDKSFPDITSEAETLERFYKTQLYDHIYHYSSYIQAFEDYGIDCAQMGIHSYTLMRWDMDDFYILYSIKKELEADLADNPYYDSKAFSFNTYRSSKNRYMDKLDYYGWRFYYTEETARQLEEYFDGFVRNYYEKFHLNFSKESE